jgi:hypothetical protein
MQTEYQTKQARNDDQSGEFSAEIEWRSGDKLGFVSVHGL